VLPYVYYFNNRSILSAVLLHFTYNFTFSLVYPISVTVYLILVILLFITTVGIVLVGKSRK